MSHKKYLVTLLSAVMLLSLLFASVAANGTLAPTVTKIAAPETINLAGSGGQEETTVTIQVSGAGGTSSTVSPMDVVFALDSSGSMASNDPAGERRTAAKLFLSKMDAARDLAGVVSWDDGIDFTQALTNNFTLVESAIDAVDSSGGTNLDAGLSAAIGLLDSGAQSGSVRVIIFLTDGYGSYTYYPGNPIKDAADKGYVIYAIGLGSAASGPLIDMATATSGAYYAAPTADNLQAIFEAIFTEIVTSTIPQNVDVVEVTQAYIIDEAAINPVPTSVTTDGVTGYTTIIWEDVDLLDGVAGMPDGEVVTLSFTAKSNLAGTALPVQVEGQALVHYDDSDGVYVGSVPIPQDTINVNAPPDCSTAASSKDRLWPPNHRYATISVLGVTDPEGAAISIVIDSIFQDEPTDTVGDGRFTPDGDGVGTDRARVRAERAGPPALPGNGRVYEIGFTATDALGASCSGLVSVGVPHDVRDTPVNDGATYDSTIP